MQLIWPKSTSSSYKKQKLVYLEDNSYEAISFENIESILTQRVDEQIRKYINTLPESLKTTLLQKLVKYEDISKITDTPIGTVRSRIFKPGN